MSRKIHLPEWAGSQVLFQRAYQFRQRIAAPVQAIPVDLFRISAALVVFGYLVRLFIEAPLFHTKDGLLDHQIIRDVFWFTSQPLFSETHPLWLTQGWIALAGILTLGIIIGWHPRKCAFGAYVIVVCSIRHRFLIVSVDDVIIHLLLFWLFVLPIGTTLTLRRGNGPAREQLVPGGAVRLFACNIALIYFVAGISKWGSEMWLDGSALFAIMSVRPGWFSNVITLDWLPPLQVLNYLALLIEPFLAAIPFLRTGHAIKKMLGLLLVGLHVFIIASLDVVFANLGCMAALPILFREELMRHTSRSLPDTGRWRSIDTFAAVVLIFIFGAMTCSLTQRNWRKPSAENKLAEVEKDLPSMAGGPEQLFFFGGLWMVGLIQQYRLLDWIDDRNFAVRVHIEETLDSGPSYEVHEYALVPPGMRSSLTLSYLLGATWLPIPPDQMPDLRYSILKGLAHRYAQSSDQNGRITVMVTRYRITPYIPKKPPEPKLLMEFRCKNGSAHIDSMNLNL